MSQVEMPDGTFKEFPNPVIAGTPEYDEYIAVEAYWRKTPHECDIQVIGDTAYPCSRCGCV